MFGIDDALLVLGGGALLGAGASLFGASKSAGASEAATQAATASNAEAVAVQKQAIEQEWKMYQQNREDFAPWREAGGAALGKLTGMVGAGPGGFDPSKTPGYEFGFKNFIEKPYLNMQSAKGKRLSGETMKGLTRYASDYAETAYDNFLNRYYKSLTPLQSLAGVGMTSTQDLANLGAGTVGRVGNISGNIGNIAMNTGQIQSQNAMNLGNIYSGAGLGIAGMGQGLGQNYLNYLMLSKILPGGGTAGPGMWG